MFLHLGYYLREAEKGVVHVPLRGAFFVELALALGLYVLVIVDGCVVEWFLVCAYLGGRGRW